MPVKTCNCPVGVTSEELQKEWESLKDYDFSEPSASYADIAPVVTDPVQAVAADKPQPGFKSMLFPVMLLLGFFSLGLGLRGVQSDAWYAVLGIANVIVGLVELLVVLYRGIDS